MARRKRRKTDDTPMVLNITSLMDILTTLVFFLLVHYSVEAPYNPTGELRLPLSTSKTPAIDALKVIASRTGVAIGTERVATIRDDEIYDAVTGAKIMTPTIPRMITIMNDQAKKVREVVKLNPDKKFEGHVILEADATLPYSIIRRLMSSAGQTDWVMFKFAVTKLVN